LSGMADLDGIICAAVTPVTPEYRIDVPALARHCNAVLDEGCSYVSVFGTTGEGVSFSATEKVQAMQTLVGPGVPAARLVPAIMTPVLSEAADMLAAAEAAGCRAALVLPPFFYTDPGDVGVLAFFDALLDRAASTGIDLVLYNIPRFSRISYSVGLVEALVNRFGERIVGIKDSTGDLQNSLSLVRAFPDLSVFTGDDRVMPTLRQAGGAGMIGGMPNLFAADACGVLAAPDAAGTEALRGAAGHRIAAVDGNGGLAALKAMLARRYDDPGWARVVPPLTPLGGAGEKAVLAALAETGYDPAKAA